MRITSIIHRWFSCCLSRQGVFCWHHLILQLQGQIQPVLMATEKAEEAVTATSLVNIAFAQKCVFRGKHEALGLFFGPHKDMTGK